MEKKMTEKETKSAPETHAKPATAKPTPGHSGTEKAEPSAKPATEPSPELEKAQKQIAELTDTCKRVQADFENYRKRVERDQEQNKLNAKKYIIQNILVILDNLHLALRNAPKNDFARGVELIYAQLLSTLEAEGLKVIDEKVFSPRYHEVLLTEKSDKPKGTILEVLQQGYLLGDTVIRSAKVKLAQ